MGDAANPVLPDFTNQTASVYKANIDAGFAVADRLAWAFAPHEQGTPDMTVRLAAGAIFDGATLTEVAAQSTGTITAPSTNPRIDRVAIDRSTGAVSVVTGTEDVSPTAPAIPAGKVPVARVALTTGTTEIANSDITDERDFTNLGTGTGTNQVPTNADVVSFDSGTTMLFHQNAAPTGWTKDVAATLDNSALRIVTSTAWAGGKQGATAFTSVFGSGKTAGAHTLSTGEIPAHAHMQRSQIGGGVNGTVGQAFRQSIANNGNSGLTATDGGSGGSHDHTLSLDLNYINLIIATKD